MHALVLDLTHGGDVLCERLLQQGYEVTCVDVYGLSTVPRMDQLRSLGAKVTTTVPAGHYDLMVSPVHCPDRFLTEASWSERRTFHEMVGMLMPENGPHRIEVTGVKGKTSTVHILAHLLHQDGRSVLLHSSRGLYHFGPEGLTLVQEKVSINPVSLLTLPELDVDHVVAEVSLGGSGNADISVITNLVDDYLIAGGTRRACGAKSSILNPRGLNLVPDSEIDIWAPYGLPLVIFRPSTELLGGNRLGEGQDAVVDYGGTHHIRLASGYLHSSYITAFDTALAVCKNLSLPLKSLLKGLQNFRGVPGRGEVHVQDMRTLVLERNPGISAASMLHTLESLSTITDISGCRIQVNPVNRKVCEKLERGAIEDLAERYHADLVWTEGDLGPHSQYPLDLLFIKEGYQ